MTKIAFLRAIEEVVLLVSYLNNKLTVKCTQMCTFWAPFSVNFILYNLSPQIHVKYSMIFHWPSNMMAKCHFFIGSGGSSSYFAIPQPPLIFFSKKLFFCRNCCAIAHINILPQIFIRDCIWDLCLTGN